MLNKQFLQHEKIEPNVSKIRAVGKEVNGGKNNSFVLTRVDWVPGRSFARFCDVGANHIPSSGRTTASNYTSCTVEPRFNESLYHYITISLYSANDIRDKAEVKMAEYWPSSYFLRDGVKVRENTRSKKKTKSKKRPSFIKRTRPILGHLGRTSLVNKGFVTLKKNTIFLRDTAGNPERMNIRKREAHEKIRKVCSITEVDYHSYIHKQA